MAVVASDIKFYLSGGAGNTSGDASLGGLVSSTEASSNLNELFDYVTAYQAYSGDTNYRCIYVKNTNATDTLYYSDVHIYTNIPSVAGTAYIGLGTAEINGQESTIANEATAPHSVTFSAASTSNQALSIGDLAPGAHKAIWIKRQITSSTVGAAGDSVVLQVRGGTAV